MTGTRDLHKLRYLLRILPGSGFTCPAGILIIAASFLAGCGVAGYTTAGIMGAGFIPHRLNNPQRSGRDDAGSHVPQPPAATSLARIMKDKSERKRIKNAFEEVHPEFNLHIVEFDDQGWFWNREAYKQTLRCIAAEANTNLTTDSVCEEGRRHPGEWGETEGALMVTFVHGWKNNAAVCNDNLACFRESLAVLADRERELTAEKNKGRTAGTKPFFPRRVIGIYVAWRGETEFIEPWKELSVWGRKLVAERIGHSSDAAELFSALDLIHRRLNELGGPFEIGRYNTLVYVGHSFGADLLYSSTAPVITRLVPAADGQQGKLRGLGDLVVLVNAAFEAEFYESFYQRTLEAGSTFAKGQVPVLLSITSEGDWATHYLFPFSQFVMTPVAGARRPGEVRPYFDSVGHYAPFLTHRLGFAATAAEEKRLAISRQLDRTKPAVRPSCGCAYGLFERYMRLKGKPQIVPSLLNINGSKPIAPNSPFLNVSASTLVIKDHNDIFNPVFLDFLVDYVGRMQVAAEAELNKPQLRGGL